MPRIYILILWLFPFVLIGQKQYVKNFSLEEWENGMPTGWIIEKNTVDVFKADQKIIPFGVKTDDKKFRAVFPDSGSDRLTYIGLAGDEIISGTLLSPLEKNNFYELSFYVYNPPLYTDRSTKKFTIQFQNDKGNAPVILLEADVEIDTTIHKWIKVSKIIKGSGMEKRVRIGFLGNHYKEHPFNTSGLYYLFDEISIKPLEPVSDTLNIFFATGNAELSSEAKNDLQSIKEVDYINPSIKLEGYASALGSTDDNLKLSKERILKVKRYLENELNVITDAVNPIGEIQSKSGDNKKDRKVSVVIDYLGVLKNERSKIPKTNYSSQLIKQMTQMIESDQSIRQQYDSIHIATSKDTLMLNAILNKMRFIDSVNIKLLTQIFDRHGYPGVTLVGPGLMDAGFLILQHAELETRLKYESLIKDAIAKGEATKTWLPYFEDRNLLDQDKKQIYGTQLYWDETSRQYQFFEIEDRKEADRLRLKQRMGTLKEYLNAVNSN